MYKVTYKILNAGGQSLESRFDCPEKVCIFIQWLITQYKPEGFILEKISTE